MKKLRVLYLLVPFIGSSAIAHAQTATLYGMTALTVTAYSVHSYSHSEFTYSASLYYDLTTEAWFFQDYTLLGHPIQYGGSYHDLNLYAVPTPGHFYQTTTYHSLFAYYVVYMEYPFPSYFYYDPYGFNLLSTPNPPPQEDPVFVTGVYGVYYVIPAFYILGATWDGDGTYPPTLAGLILNGSQVRGGSGSLEAWGDWLTTQNAGPTFLNVDGAGVSVNFTFSDSRWLVFGNYSISPTATTGTHNFRVSTVWGTSNPMPFTVGDPTPVISSVVPDPWVSGTATNFTLNGSGFGSNPSLSITGPGITGFTKTSGSDTVITGSVTVAPGATGTATITVTSTGFGGNAFFQAPKVRVRAGRSRPAISRSSFLCSSRLSMWHTSQSTTSRDRHRVRMVVQFRRHTPAMGAGARIARKNKSCWFHKRSSGQTFFKGLAKHEVTAFCLL
jgi:hypothetical protein